ncbi:Di-copper centre-containing protein [Rutstroemia sp. NJR-2017a BVV2]|nr:Di-copper centre-containing protein [Rutstroemia sp. NJR-2017a BVV2]
MPRTHPRGLTHVLLFLTALVLIIYLGGSSSSSSSRSPSLPLSKIAYVPKHPTPPSHGSCPGLHSTTKPALIISHVSADGPLTWLDPLRSQYHICAYEVDASPRQHDNVLRVPMNKGHEAMAYLTFIIDNYDALPAEGMVFVHGSRYAWHNDHPAYDNLPLLQSLSVPRALRQNAGYANLRCDWSVSTCRAAAKPQGSWETKLQATMQPWDKRAKSDVVLARVLGDMFGIEIGRGDVLRSQCCAQFVVGRENVWGWEREDYVRLRGWVMETGEEDRVSGRVVSYLWGVLFLGKGVGGTGTEGRGVSLQELNSRACPSAEECYCRVYGKCGLECGDKGGCKGQYRLPSNFKLPEDWATRHSET